MAHSATTPWWAVRSSGSAEDLEEAPFARQHDTYLDVRGLDRVLDAIKGCWASLWTARATSYRHRNGFDHLDANLAVVVQTMVAADVAGVLFTSNPATQTNEFVINATWGLGEAYSLSDEQAADLRELGRQVMTYYGWLPQEIEWALSDGRLYLLQARPVPRVA